MDSNCLAHAIIFGWAMRGILVVLMWALIVSGCGSASAQVAPKSRTFDRLATDADIVPDLSWIPKPGDEANTFTVSGGGVFGAVGVGAFEECVKYLIAGDEKGLSDLRSRRQAALLDDGTKVLVLQRTINQFIADGRHALEVRILDGKNKDSKLWMLESQVERLIPRDRIRDANYRIVEGDQVVIVNENTFLSGTWAALDELAKGQKAKDRAIVDAAIEAGDMFILPRNTKVLVVAVHIETRSGNKGKARDLVALPDDAAKYATTHPAGYVCEVKVLEGDYLNREAFVSRRNLGRFIDRTPGIVPLAPAPRNKAKTPLKTEPKAVSPENQAVAKVLIGKNLRFNGNREGAVENFRVAIKLAPASAAAKEAKTILKAMGVPE